MKIILSLVFSFFGVAAAAAMTLAPTTTVATVADGARTRIGFSFSLNQDCSVAGPIIVRVLQAPKNGNFESVDEEGFSSYEKSDQRFRCNTESRIVQKYFYTSNIGFTGKDQVVIETFFSNGNSRKRIFNITIK